MKLIIKKQIIFNGAIMTEKDYSHQLGRIINIDYQTDWILKELKRTNELIEEQNKLNYFLIKLIEHMLENYDNPEKMKDKVKMEMARGIR